MPNKHNNLRVKENTPKTAGIYRLKNKITGDFYIGQSKHIEARWQEHSQLAEHPLYASMAKYGLDNFEFEILEHCGKDENLLEKERAYIKELKPTLQSQKGERYRAKLKKPVIQIDPETGAVLGEYESQTQAAKMTDVPQPQISATISGRQPTAGGYIWKRAD